MNNPFEIEEVKNNEIELLSKKIEKLELIVKETKKTETELKKLKDELLEKVYGTNFVTWKTPNGTKFTLVEAIEPKVEQKKVFAEILFKNDYPDLYNKYLNTVEETKSGKKAYIRITLPKESLGKNNE